MSVSKHMIVALIGAVVLAITTYLFLFKFYETLFWIYNLDPRLIYGSIDGSYNDYYEAHGRIIPAKKPFYYIQVAQVITLFTYCFLVKLKSSGKVIVYNVTRPQITHSQGTQPISRVILYIAGAFLILYIIIGFLGSIAPYGILG